MNRVRGSWIAAAVLALFASCAKGPDASASRPAVPAAFKGVAVFVPGVVSGSPIYEMLAAGARQAAESVPGTTFRVVEAGFNQAEWLDKLAALAASGEFDLIVTSNPALPELCAKVAESYPSMRFFAADAYLPGNPAIHTVLYNQLEQGYIVGYLAGLITTSGLPGANRAKKAEIGRAHV